MAHKEQKEYCNKIRANYPENFNKVLALDCGSLDINGNNRYLFTDSIVIGVDLIIGKNVDLVSNTKNVSFRDNYFDTIISTEMLEHDSTWYLSIQNMIRMLKPSGLLLLTMATDGRNEHGTENHNPEDSPATNDYYQNLTEKQIRAAINIEASFKEYAFEVNINSHDLYFFGIKR